MSNDRSHILFFDIPDTLQPEQYASRLCAVIANLVLINELPAEQNDHLKAIVDSLSDMGSRINNTHSRKDLYSLLKKHPFASTLMLLPEPNEKDSNTRALFYLFAELYTRRGSDDYDAYLNFYKSFLKPDAPIVPFTFHFLRESTTDEIRHALTVHATRCNRESVRDLAPYFQKRRTTSVSPSRNSVVSAPNRHHETLQSSESRVLTYMETSDELGQKVGAVLGLTPTLELRSKQERLKFIKKQAGIQNALYNAEASLAYSMNAASPAELATFLDSVNPALLDAEFSEITPLEASYLTILFLRLLGVRNPGELMLVNQGGRSAQVQASRPHSIEYKLDRERLHISATLNLDGQLVKTQQPETSEKVHYVSNHLLSLTLPFPIGTLLNISLRAVVNHRRNNTTLHAALGIAPPDYTRWLRAKLKSSHLKDRGISKAILERCFHHFASEDVPATYLNFLSSNSTVQSHYVSVESTTFEITVFTNWKQFCDQVGFKQLTFNSMESSRFFTYNRTYNSEVGSPLTLRSEVIEAVLEHLITMIKTLPQLDMSSLVQKFNLIGLYIYIRMATTVALRPVNRPFPELKHVHPALGAFTVADKRSHHADERRLIVLPTRLRNLALQFHDVARTLSPYLRIEAPSALLMHLDASQPRWCDYSRKLVNSKLTELTAEPIINHSFRHCSVHKFINHHVANSSFSQKALNLLLNHSRANVSALNSHSLLSVNALIAKQRELLDPLDTVNTDLDNAALKALHITQADLK